MMKKLFTTGSGIAAALTMGLAATPALAQDSEEIVVTGSNIRGTPEDAALPVDVITAQALEDQGSPTLVQLVRTLPSAAASYGEGYRFGAAPAGSATVNLRGLGASRTLVLLNGRRFAATVPVATAPGLAVDLNLLPTAAVGRVEVLRDGAAAVYGSDAIGGVLNFITRRDLDGFDIDTEYSAISGSDGDWHANTSWGMRGDNGNILLSFGYRHRSQLETQDRDWALRPFPATGVGGGWSTSGNGVYVTTPSGTAVTRDPVTGAITSSTDPWITGDPGGATAAVTFTDPGCNGSGQFQTSTSCAFQFSRFENLTNPEDAYQLYGEVNYGLTPDVDFHAEIAWFRLNAEQSASPINQTAQYPQPIGASSGSLGGGASPFPAGFTTSPLISVQNSRYFVPRTNPGLVALVAANCPGVGNPTWCDGAATDGVLTSATAWRALSTGGNLQTPRGNDVNTSERNGFRTSASLEGPSFFDTHWNAAISYTNVDSLLITHDFSINRLTLALRGLGGANCNPNPISQGGDYDPALDGPTPASVAAGRCSFLNPFTNSLAGNYTGVAPSQMPAVVPQTTATQAVAGYGTPFALANNAALIGWTYQTFNTNTLTQNLTGDFVLDGSLPIELGGGPIQWAAGVQWRYDRQQLTYNAAADIDATPCPDSLPYGDGAPFCSPVTGSTIFFAGNRRSDVDRITQASYAEVRLPFTDDFEVSAAIRHEQFSGLSTTDPRLSARWQVLDWLALRASGGTTFRAPPQTFLIEEANRGVINFTNTANAINFYRAADLYGNRNLQAETADSYSVGFLVDAGPFRASIDYFNYRFENEITTENAATLFTNFFFPTGGTINGVAQSSFCETGDSQISQLRSRMNFASGVCHDGSDAATFGAGGAQDFNGINRYNYINGPSINTSGLDMSASLDFDDVLDGQLTVGVDTTYLIEYVRGAVVSPLLGGLTLEATSDRTGRSNSISQFFSYPQWRGSAFWNYHRGPANIRWTTHFTSGVTDTSLAAAGIFVPVEEAITHDLTFRYELENIPGSPTLTMNIANLTDANPPFLAAGFYNYVPYASDIVGRQLEIGLNMHF